MATNLPKDGEPRTVVAPNGTLREPNGTLSAPDDTGASPKKGIVRRIFPWALLVLILGGAVYGWTIVKFYETHETTDDAQIDADESPIIARVSGYILTLPFAENATVQKGDTLATLDGRDLQIQLQVAEAAYADAVASVHAAQAAVVAANASIRTAEVHEQKAKQDVARDKALVAGNAITEQQLLTTESAYAAATAQLNVAQQQAASVGSRVAVAQAAVAAKQAEIDKVKLELSYTAIVAPIDGVVAKRHVEVGELIQAGQPLMAVSPGDIWITANFKETQITHLRPGEPVTFDVDAYPDHEFRGTVESMSPATGAKFALLPPDNATGNFVKVTQRLPVRIRVDPSSIQGRVLRPGLSVDVTVSTAATGSSIATK